MGSLLGCQGECGTGRLKSVVWSFEIWAGTLRPDAGAWNASRLDRSDRSRQEIFFGRSAWKVICPSLLDDQAVSLKNAKR
jgi:hypothetical protein